MKKLFNKQCKKIENILFKYKTFEKYLNIQNNDNEQLRITIGKPKQSKGDYILTINLNILFIRKINIHMILLNKIMKKNNIATDLFFRITNTYLPSKIDMNIKICFEKEWPFYPPHWELYSIKTNIKPQQIELKNYYKYVIQNHNNMNGFYWTPAISIEKDIIEFIQKINHFEFIY